MSALPSKLYATTTYVLEWVDALRRLLDFASDDLWNQLCGKLAESAGAGFARHDINHLLPDGSDLGGGGVCGLLNLVWSSLGEGDAEKTEEVVVGGLDNDVGFDEGLPLSDEGSQLVGCEVETVEVGQAVLALNLVDAESDLAEGMVLILLQIGQGDLEYSALQCIVGVLETGGAVDEGLSDASW